MTITIGLNFLARFCSAVFLFCIVLISHAYAIDLSNAEKEFLSTKGTIVFVSQTHYPPFEFTDEHLQHEGMMLDIIRWMAVEMSFHPVFLDMPFLHAQQAVISGQADIITSLFPSEKRKETFEFTDTLFDVPASIFVKAERTDVKGLKDLNGKTIAIQRGDYAKEYLESQKIHFNTVDTEDFAEAIDQIISGKADAVIGDEQIVLYHIFSNRLTDQVKKVHEPLYIGKNCMAANKDKAILIDILNKGIHEARKTGVLDKISKKWLGTNFGYQKSFLERHFWPLSAAAGCLLLVSIGVWVWNVRLRILVRKKTEVILHRETALRESERNFRTFFDTMDDMLLVSGPDGKICYSNSAVSIKLGYKQAELEKMDIVHMHPSAMREEAEAIYSAICKGEMNVCPFPLESKTGTLIPVESREWLGQWNGTDCIFCISKDLSKEQEALQKFNRLFDNNPAPMSVLSLPDKKFTDVNNAFIHALGFSREEILGKTSGELRLFVDMEVHHRFIEQYQKEGKIIQSECKIRCKDGAILDGLFSGEVIESQGQQFFLAVMVDQTERKSAVNKLRESEELHRLLVTNINEGFFMTDGEGFLTFGNEALARIYGFDTPTECIGKQIFDLVAPQARETARQIFSEAVASGQAPAGFEIPTLRKNGEIVQTEVKPTIFFQKDGAVIIQGLLIDISERRRIEEERRQWERQGQQIEKAESLNRMAGAIAHHFNNMLGAIMGNIELAVADLPRGSDIAESLTEAMKASHRAAEMSSLMLTYLGQTISHHESLDLTDICRGCLPLFRTVLQKNVVLETDFLSSGPVINANVGQVQQLIRNLVANASESIENTGGTIHLTVRTVSAQDISMTHRFPIDGNPQDNYYACIAVKDTGAGITDKEIEQIFDPFFSTKFTGRGLGLSVALGIVRAHNGVITVESSLGRGSVFRVFLPLAQQPAPPRSEEQSVPTL